MQCPRCEGATHVLESRPAEEGQAVRRRRKCAECATRFTTFERVAVARIHVRKRSNERQPFDAEKLRGALMRAAHKRPISARQIHGIVAAAEAEATAFGGTIDTHRIGAICLEHLRELDRGAYLQFAGTLPDFNPEIGVFSSEGSVRGTHEHG